ncbi:hypothetical protein ACA910_001580 [Epithemia clementina (nom. ined.)]
MEQGSRAQATADQVLSVTMQPPYGRQQQHPFVPPRTSLPEGMHVDVVSFLASLPSHQQARQDRTYDVSDLGQMNPYVQVIQLPHNSLLGHATMNQSQALANFNHHQLQQVLPMTYPYSRMCHQPQFQEASTLGVRNAPDYSTHIREPNFPYQTNYLTQVLGTAQGMSPSMTLNDRAGSVGHGQLSTIQCQDQVASQFDPSPNLGLQERESSQQVLSSCLGPRPQMSK